MNLGELFQFLSRHIPPVLIAEEGVDILAAPLTSCPPLPSVMIGMETPLNKINTFPDMAYNFTYKEAPAFMNHLTDELASPFVDSFKSYLRHWAGKKSLQKLSDYVWLEFDSPGQKPFLPLVFFHLPRGEHKKVREKKETFGFPAQQEKAWDLLEEYLNQTGSRLNYLGYTPSRDRENLRVSLTDLDAPLIGPMTEKILPRETWSELTSLVKELAPAVPRLRLHLDIKDTIQPRIGIEFHMDDPLNMDNQGGWEPVLETLEKKGFCLKEKKEALLEWPGVSREMFHPLLFKYYTYRYLYYVKANFQPGRPPRFKAYFCFANHKID